MRVTASLVEISNWSQKVRLKDYQILLRQYEQEADIERDFCVWKADLPLDVARMLHCELSIAIDEIDRKIRGGI